ncbi:MAG: Hsp70 family protein [Planctomycetia bacterium]|nr:Hsp70 family protein [Planctomycetia bacterium]
MCYIDLQTILDADGARRFNVTPKIETFFIPQAVAPNIIEERPTLPSYFARLPHTALLPWEDATASEAQRDFSRKSRSRTAKGDGKVGVVGVYARDYGVTESESYVASVKSWLCHESVDRVAKFLPVRTGASQASQASGDTTKWSPIQISSFFLAHLHQAWNQRFPDYPLQTQQLVVTIPASFDETARALTIQAAKEAGLKKIALIEEPQAAFYSWLARHEEDWTRRVQPGQKILVCDIGGGTTDFALIYALKRCESSQEEPGAREVNFYRVAVGEHLILGGDNLDLALYRFIEKEFQAKLNRTLTESERAALLRESRLAKEYFLGAKPASERAIRLQGAGSKLLSGGTSIQLTAAQAQSVLIDGFFPLTSYEQTPSKSRRGGLRELALPYAQDPAITKHLAAFLSQKRGAGAELLRAGVLGNISQETAASWTSEDPLAQARPDAILFNGGAFESPQLRKRVIDSITNWFSAVNPEPPTVLENDDLYLAVARGAAYYGLALQGHATKVGASLARSYYIGVDLQSQTESHGSAQKTAVCLLGAQNEPGDQVEVGKEFLVRLDRPASFPLYMSSARMTDAPGDLIQVDPNQTRELAPICTALKSRSQRVRKDGQARVKLVARPTEIGTIELYLQEILDATSGSRSHGSRWTLQFDARGAVQTDWEQGDVSGEREGALEESLIESASGVVLATFGSEEELAQWNEKNKQSASADVTVEALGRIKPRDFFGELQRVTGMSRTELPVTALRRLGELALFHDANRKSASAVEARWLNWIGFAFRPGFGASTDDWRVEQVWKRVTGQLTAATPECRAQYWILWRRIASGLTAGRQTALAEPALKSLRIFRKQTTQGGGRSAPIDFVSHEGAEIWRTLGALELLSPQIKVEIGDTILDIITKRRAQPIQDAALWALGRLGTRVMFHAPLDKAVDPTVAQRWVETCLTMLKEGKLAPQQNLFFALALCAREAPQTSFNVPASLRERVMATLSRYEQGRSAAELAVSMTQGQETSSELFGEQLPNGLIWERGAEEG